MLFGPVFRAELLRTSRRKRYYVIRMLYGLALFLLIWSGYTSLIELSLRYQRYVLISRMAHLAFQSFLAFTFLQAVILLIMIPSLFGGVVADEKERKTIHYLMASQLSSREIVLDKWLARMLHVVVFVLAGLPILSLLSLLGGIPWEYLVGAYSGTFSMVFLTTALATLVSTLARRVRQGVLIAYLLIIFWLIVPCLATAVCRILFPNAYVWINAGTEMLPTLSPVSFFLDHLSSLNSPRGGPWLILEPFLWMIGAQVGTGLLLLVVAMHQLRPSFQRQESGTRRLTWFRPRTKRHRWFDRPACGTDAMLWKECYFARTDVFTKLVVLPATILLTVFLLLTSGLDEALWNATKELFHIRGLSGFHHRNALNQSLRQITPIYVGLWMLAVAGASASSVTVEREEDTWISLTSTPLSGNEILRGKMIGSVWGLRGFGGLLGLLWLMGLLTGAVHPLGILLGLALVALLTWEVAALGSYASLNTRSSSRALTTTIVSVLVANGGFLLLVYPILIILNPYLRFSEGGPEWWSPRLICTPYLASIALLSFDDVNTIFGRSVTTSPLATMSWPAIVFIPVVLLVHASIAGFLTLQAHQHFDTIADRPG